MWHCKGWINLVVSYWWSDTSAEQKNAFTFASYPSLVVSLGFIPLQGQIGLPVFSHSLCKAISPRGMFSNSCYQQRRCASWVVLSNWNCFLIPYYQHFEWMLALKTCSRPTGLWRKLLAAPIGLWTRKPDATPRVNHSTMHVRLSAGKRICLLL